MYQGGKRHEDAMTSMLNSLSILKGKALNIFKLNSIQQTFQQGTVELKNQLRSSTRTQAPSGVFFFFFKFQVSVHSKPKPFKAE